MSTNKRKSPTSETKISTYDIPWVEKYRPRNLEDVVGNEETLVRLRAIAEDGNMPNLILCGPPGTGKVCVLFFFDAAVMLSWGVLSGVDELLGFLSCIFSNTPCVIVLSLTH
jgi:replication-associated recombination protein RarA